MNMWNKKVLVTAIVLLAAIDLLVGYKVLTTLERDKQVSELASETLRELVERTGIITDTKVKELVKDINTADKVAVYCSWIGQGKKVLTSYNRTDPVFKDITIAISAANHSGEP
ncbi:MAG TPA: hypothetical protein VE439_02750 [Anaerolineae bacterium]|jgi:uncharacterized tellurite resistance protein B-like protein|nr:hypothetical protein [Anaerolineae bacterium]